MSYVKSRDHRTGVTYVYESKSYWDKEKKQPRSTRKLIGKIDEETGEIVPTAGRGRKKKSPENSTMQSKEVTQATPKVDYLEMLREKDKKIGQLERENRELKERQEKLLAEITLALENYQNSCQQ
ncbi:MAG: hypothetical protein LUC41_05610 [Clostridiales bacterium]|nr:hypothetical protein [Clostridiales bacterium]